MENLNEKEKLIQRFSEIGDIAMLNRFLHWAKEMILYAELKKEKYLLCVVLEGQPTLRIILGNRVVLGLEKKQNGFVLEYFAEKNENFYESPQDTIKSFSKESSKGAPFVLVSSKSFDSLEQNHENFLAAVRKAKATSFVHKEYKHNTIFLKTILVWSFRKRQFLKATLGNIPFDRSNQDFKKHQEKIEKIMRSSLDFFNLDKIAIKCGESINKIYGIDYTVDSVFSETSLHEFSLSGIKDATKWKGLNEGKEQAETVPFRLVMGDFMYFTLENSEIFTHTTYAKYFNFLIDKAESVILLQNASFFSLSDVKFDGIFDTINFIRHLEQQLQKEDYGLTFYADDDIFSNLIDSPGIFYPIYDAFIQISKGEPHRFEEQFEKAMSYYHSKHDGVDLPISNNSLPTLPPKPRLYFPKNQILYGAPGTGKTYSTVDRALAILENTAIEDLQKEDRKTLKNRFQEYTVQGRIGFVTFHQSFSYEDFVEGIKPQTLDNQVVFGIEKGIFRLMAEKAMADEGKPYVLIIDEINRGNVSQIFGELITLLEEDKRLGETEALSVLLPYSKEAFGVAANLYLIGTMNTADRSIEALDTALRRRFSFVEMPPDPSVLGKVEAGQETEIELGKLLAAINARLELLLGRDRAIGHAYLLNIRTLENLKSVFSNKIIPLLQEYFYNDFGKIGLVLGKNFVEKKPKFALLDFDKDYRDTKNDLEERNLYVLRKPEHWTAADFRGLY